MRKVGVIRVYNALPRVTFGAKHAAIGVCTHMRQLVSMLMRFLSGSWYLVIYGITLLRRRKKVFGHFILDLVIFRPLPNSLEISADVLSVEVDVRFWEIGCGRLKPHLAHHTNVDRTHQLLTYDVEAMCCGPKLVSDENQQ